MPSTLETLREHQTPSHADTIFSQRQRVFYHPIYRHKPDYQLNHEKFAGYINGTFRHPDTQVVLITANFFVFIYDVFRMVQKERKFDWVHGLEDIKRTHQDRNGNEM